MKILLIEDDEKISNFIKKGLEEEAFIIDTAFDGEEGFYLAQIYTYDLIILDLMLPKLDGIEVCKRVRQINSKIPILMLTAKNKLEDKINGFEHGADDYLSKPFFFNELMARIKALLRRNMYNNSNHLEIENLEINLLSRSVKRDNNEIELSVKEYELLILLAKNRGKIVTTTQIAETIWNIQESTSSNVINVFIHHLRGKIDFQNQKKLIKTVRGSGYKIE